jgi:hypothetical protein
MSDSWSFEDKLREDLFAAVPGILAGQKENGQFGEEPWICQDQNALLALAAAWNLEGSPYYQSRELVDAIGRGGKALVEAQDEEGMWTFRKKDHSTWGQIYMPWTYSRWIRAYQVVREALSPETRKVWDRGLLLGYEGIARTALDRIHNIPAHHAMGLYCAGQVFDRLDWREQASAFLLEVIGAQSEHGWWSENFGPVVMYNFVYSEALGTYYALSGDKRVLEALERAAQFHANYVYPDGSIVETIDERNPYHRGVRLGNAGFSLTPAGRGFIKQQHQLHLAAGGNFDADYAANMLLYGRQGEIEETAAGKREHTHSMGRDALVVRRAGWYISLSAYIAPPKEDRWRQDRQNFVSIYHDRTGLIVGGGNSKLQPLWSTFTAGDTSLMQHTPGEKDPDFGPRPGLIHVPDSGDLRAEGVIYGLELNYGGATGAVEVAPGGENELRLTYAVTRKSALPIEAHVTLVPRLEFPLELSSGEQVDLQEETLEWSGAWISHAGWKLSLPEGAKLIWSVLPHNPYRKGGEATVEEGLLVIVLPFAEGVERHELSLIIE